MRSFLFILTLLFGMLLFLPIEEVSSSTADALSKQQEAVMKEKSSSDINHHLQVLSSELKGSNCLTPRRVVQHTSNTLNIRLFKYQEKFSQYFRLKGEDLLQKVSEEVTICQTTNLSTLLCRNGYHVYALRRIII